MPHTPPPPHLCRFHVVSQEPMLDHNVVPHLDDNRQLSVEHYQDRLYHSIVEKRLQLRRGRQGGREEEEREDETTPTPHPLSSGRGGHTPSQVEQCQEPLPIWYMTPLPPPRSPPLTPHHLTSPLHPCTGHHTSTRSATPVHGSDHCPTPDLMDTHTHTHTHTTGFSS